MSSDWTKKAASHNGRVPRTVLVGVTPVWSTGGVLQLSISKFNFFFPYPPA